MMTSFGSEIPRKLCWNLDCKVVQYVFIPLYSLSLSLQVRCAVVCWLSQIFPSPSSFLLTTLSCLKNPLYLIHSWQLFLRESARPSGVPRGPAISTGSLASQRHPGKFPKVPGKGEGHEGRGENWLPGWVWNANPRSLSPLESNVRSWTQA